METIELWQLLLIFVAPPLLKVIDIITHFIDD